MQILLLFHQDEVVAPPTGDFPQLDIPLSVELSANAYSINISDYRASIEVEETKYFVEVID
jgi:hypothetical protein